MKGSFVSQIFDQSVEARRLYLRGPTAFGTEVDGIANAVARFVLRSLDDGDRKIVLAGYSRGGAAIVVAANRLNPELRRRGIRIEAIFLFDAVDRDRYTDSSTVPDCVSIAYHALRSPAVGSRNYFGNAAAVAAPPAILHQKWFAGTHAALGGLPWSGDHPNPWHLWHDALRPRPKAGSTPTLTARLRSFRADLARGRAPLGSNRFVGRLEFSEVNDQDAMRHVRNWMWPLLAKHGVLAG
jgi:hypothetical protein